MHSSNYGLDQTENKGAFREILNELYSVKFFHHHTNENTKRSVEVINTD